MDRLVSYCGLVCTDCTAYIATQADDQDDLERVAALWQRAFDSPDIDVASITCDGCLAFDGRLSGYCHHCVVRPCGIEKGIANCAHCPDYACEKLEDLLARMERFFAQHQGFYVHEPDPRALLEALHAQKG